MKYDFDTVVNRRNTNSLKWDVKENELPMWVADMDFETAPKIQEAIRKRAAHGVFGYAIIPEGWYQAIINWWERRHDFKIEKEWLIFCTGIVPAISSMVRKLTTVGENVLVQSPVYNIFYNSILNNGRNVLENPLVYENGEYRIDWEDLEEKLKNPQTTMMILCNPHNPVGKIWDKEDLKRIGELCFQYHVVVVSDEIHCDLTEPGYEYIPFAAVSEKCRENSVTCIAPTKAFNLAGLQTAAVFASDENLRHKVWRGLNTDEVAEGNVFAAEVAEAAFTYGDEWLDELRAYISENKKLVTEFIQEEIPKLQVVPSKATYLMWLDCSNLKMNGVQFAKFLREETGLYLSGGLQYGTGGEQFMRMNVACSRKVVQVGLEKLKSACARVNSKC